MEDLQVCSSWEEIEENPSLLDQQLERLKLEKCSSRSTAGVVVPVPGGGELNSNSNEGFVGTKIKILKREKPIVDPKKKQGDSLAPVQQVQHQPIVLDPTREESLRTQYIPPEPKITLLTRPKKDTQKSSETHTKSKSAPQKSLEQREKEYMEARKRILGDVTYPEDEEEGTGGSESDGTGLSPAEILKQKVAQAMKQEGGGASQDRSSEDSKNGSGSGSGCEEPSPAQAPSGKSRKKREKFKTPHQEVPRDFPVSKTDSERILRQPRGPDGTSGFALNR